MASAADGPHPEEAAHRSRACPTSATLKCRNRKQPISMRGRLEGWTQALTRSILRDESQSKSAVADFDPSLTAEVGQARLRCDAPQDEAGVWSSIRCDELSRLRLELDVAVLHELDNSQVGACVHLHSGKQVGIHPTFVSGRLAAFRELNALLLQSKDLLLERISFVGCARSIVRLIIQQHVTRRAVEDRDDVNRSLARLVILHHQFHVVEADRSIAVEGEMIHVEHNLRRFERYRDVDPQLAFRSLLCGPYRRREDERCKDQS